MHNNTDKIAATTPTRRRARPDRSQRSHPVTERYRKVKHRYPATPILSEDELEAIHLMSLKILKEIGMVFMLPEARALLKQAGAEVDEASQRVRFDPELIMQSISTVPKEFTLHARNPERNMRIGGNNLCFLSVGSPPNVTDWDKGRRNGNQEDFRNLLKLIQSFDIIHGTGGYPVEPIDVHPNVRHLHCLRDMATLTDKPFHAYSLGSQRVEDALEIARLNRGVTAEEFEQQPSIFSVINTNSPLQLDIPMLQGILGYSAKNQPLLITPFTLSGAMAPVTLAGALAQQNAEALAGIALTQIVRPGSPVVYGGFTSNVDMKTGSPAFGTPEYMKAVMAGGQLCRKYGVPYRTSNVNAANTVDAQAAYESVFSLWGLVQGHGNLIMHAAGWLEGGLSASYEKFMLDVDLLQMVAEFLKPLDVSEAALGFEAIQEVGPGGHFFGTAHTLERFENAFYSPLISDWRNHENWVLGGSPDAMQKANTLWKQALANYEEPLMDPAHREALDAFVNRRIQEGGSATDF